MSARAEKINRINEQELANGIAGTSASWHGDHKGNAWVYVGGLSPKLSEGDVICVFSECGEIEHLNLVRDKQNGKSKGFGFLKYLDERSAILAVDNFNGVELLENVIVVNHTDYTPPKEWAVGPRNNVYCTFIYVDKL
mgnify:CR=1 FL=1